MPVSGPEGWLEDGEVDPKLKDQVSLYNHESPLLFAQSVQSRTSDRVLPRVPKPHRMTNSRS